MTISTFIMSIENWNLLAHWVGIIGIGYLILILFWSLFKLILQALVYIVAAIAGFALVGICWMIFYCFKLYFT